MANSSTWRSSISTTLGSTSSSSSRHSSFSCRCSCRCGTGPAVAGIEEASYLLASPGSAAAPLNIDDDGAGALMNSSSASPCSPTAGSSKALWLAHAADLLEIEVTEAVAGAVAGAFVKFKARISRALRVQPQPAAAGQPDARADGARVTHAAAWPAGRAAAAAAPLDTPQPQHMQQQQQYQQQQHSQSLLQQQHVTVRPRAAGSGVLHREAVRDYASHTIVSDTVPRTQ
uniref:Uncharacterized protein n=1 Tax=Tetradesmus obliquus TaxID=3088 RepID=A0A383VQC1_TETOB|eukprot:jgi/Sobl393_1/17685/SZX67093.1